LFMIALILIRIQFRLRRDGINTVKLCQSLLSDNENKVEQGSYVQSSEHLRIVGLIQQVKRPEHSENQYQQLVRLQDEKTEFLANQHRIVHWCYVPGKKYLSDNKDILELCNAAELNIVSWRQLFTKSSVRNVIAIAKNARDSNTILASHITSKNNIKMELLIDFNGKVWSGTIQRNDKLELLQAALSRAKNKLKGTENEALEEITSNTDKFSKMLLGAMIQSQGGSIDAVGASVQVYRQLTRVFDWCRQSKIVAQLQHNGQKRPISNINFTDELHAILVNAMSELHLQRNQIYLQTDRQLMEFVQVDQRLFHRMLLGIIRISMAELFNAKLLFGLKVIDLDNGMQTIRFTLTVSTAKPLKAIPELVNRLVNEDRKMTASLDIIFYLRTLMYHLNINDIQTALDDDGFKLFFDARLLMGREVSALKALPINANLKQEKIILLSDCALSKQVVLEAINGVGGVSETLPDVNALKMEYSQTVLEKRAVNLIILGDDVYKEQFDKLEAYIAELPESIQPKLMVMQHPQRAMLHKVGLYDQASTPLCQRVFQKQLVELLQSNKKNNRLIDSEILNEFQYLPTRVEVLLAVEKPEEHQTFIRILQWLGLHVQIVCQSEAMIKHWQTGRYLVLISEFSQSPLVLISTGRAVHRGVFTFKDQLFDTPEGAISNMIKNWKVSKLPNVLDIKALSALLEPWLKSKSALTPVKAVVNTVKPKPQKIQSFDEFLSESEVLNDEDKAYLDQSKILLPELADLPLDVVFDLDIYAKNQGSSELATYMLDEYTQDIENAMVKVEGFINAKQYGDVARPLSHIFKLSELMAANELNKQTIVFQDNMKTVVETGDLAKDTVSLLNVLKQECDRLIAYAEAI